MPQNPQNPWSYNNTNGLLGKKGSAIVDDMDRVVIQPDPDDPAVLQDAFILDGIKTCPFLRIAFNQQFDSLPADAQQRLTNLIEENPFLAAPVMDDQQFTDNVQAKAVAHLPVRTVGRRGGKGGSRGG